MKCFRKAGLKSCQDSQTIEEEEVDNFIQSANLEMIKEEFENYVLIDNEQMTLNVSTTEDLITDIQWWKML